MNKLTNPKRILKLNKRIFLIILTTLLHHILLAQEWHILPEKSHISFQGEHAGIPFKGNFPTYTASIFFQKAYLDKTKVTFSFDMQKVIVSDYYYQQTLLSQDWFNSKEYPHAYFEVTSLVEKKDLDHHYLVSGNLTIKNITKPLQTVVKIQSSGNKVILDGEFTINRKDFAIGTSSDPDGSWVTLEIPIHIHLETLPTKTSSSISPLRNK